jgi:hypothetical protein
MNTPKTSKPVKKAQDFNPLERAPGQTLTYDAIARRAYELFVARGASPGHAEEDWYQAERELRSRMN